MSPNRTRILVVCCAEKILASKKLVRITGKRRVWCTSCCTFHLTPTLVYSNRLFHGAAADAAFAVRGRYRGPTTADIKLFLYPAGVMAG